MTEEEINSKMTPAGGFTRSQLAEWGVPWPPPRGWKKQLVGSKLPHPLKCSKCDYVATSRADLNLHWLDH